MKITTVSKSRSTEIWMSTTPRVIVHTIGSASARRQDLGPPVEIKAVAEAGVGVTGAHTGDAEIGPSLRVTRATKSIIAGRSTRVGDTHITTTTTAAAAAAAAAIMMKMPRAPRRTGPPNDLDQ
jgi:hypothetical protein